MHSCNHIVRMCICPCAKYRHSRLRVSFPTCAKITRPKCSLGFVVLSRVNMQCMQRDIVLAIPSVCPPVQWWYCVWKNGHILVFFHAPSPSQNSKGKRLSGDVKNGGRKILQLSPFISRTVRDRPVVTMLR